MNPDEIVVHVVDRDRGNVVLDLLRECVSQPSVAADLHSHGKFCLSIKLVEMCSRIGVSDQRFLSQPRH